MGRLDGKVALVTGGASGIGRAICLSFAREGATVVCNDLRVENARQVVEECGQQASGLAVRADVSKSRQVTQMFARLAKRFSQLDILVNNAGIGLDNPTVRARFNTVLAKQQAELAKTGKIKTALEATQNLSDEEWAADAERGISTARFIAAARRSRSCTNSARARSSALPRSAA